MYKVEIVGNMAIEEDFFLKLYAYMGHIAYTKIMPVYGYGNSGYCLGDSVWPEENFMCFFVVPDEIQCKKLEKLVHDAREELHEGLACFISRDISIV